MTFTTRIRLVCSLTFVCATPALLAAQDSLVGKQVVSRLNVERASSVRLRIGDRIMGRLEAINWPITVEKMQGDWVWINDGVSRGWLPSRYLHTLDEALAEVNQAIERNPRAREYEYRGMIRDAKGEHEQAIEDYSQAIRLLSRSRSASRDDRSVPYYNRGETYLKLGNYDAAIEDMSRAISYGGSRDLQAVFYQKRGEAWTKKNETARADADFRRSRELKTR